MFRHKNSSNNNASVEASINGIKIEEVICIKYLGVILDNKLTFKQHTDHIIDKLKKGNRLLARIRHFIDYESLKNFYNAHIQSHINYCSVIWGSAASSYIDKILKFQNKSMKLLLFKGNTDASSFKSTNILPAKSIIDLSRIEYIWKITSGIFPHGSQILDDHGVLQSAGFFANKKYIQPFCRSEAARSFVACIGTRIWNKINFDLKNSASISIFKRNAKCLFLNLL